MQATIQHINQLSKSVASFSFKPERPLDYIAGQFVEIVLPHNKADNLGDMRQFTLSSSPTEQLPTFTVRFPDVGSSFKRWLQDLKPGDPLLVSDPLGDFVLPRVPSVPLVWIAGGIGVTPFRSQAMWLMSEDDHRDITFYHRTGDDTRLWRDIFADAAITPADSMTQASLLSGLQTKPDALYYIAGSPAFIEATCAHLSKKDVPADQIVTDAFLGY